MNKKAFNIGFVFLIVGIFAGAFYREFTKFLAYSGPTSMSIMHTHLLSLGTFMFMILGLLFKTYNIKDSKKLNLLLNGYLISVIVTVSTMFLRGLYQVMGWELTKVVNASISGISGLAHILLTISIIWIFNIIRKSIAIKTNTSY